MMLRFIKILIISACGLYTLSGCIDPFYPDIEEYENVLVVDGLITDEDAVYVVRLSRTLHFDDIYKKPVPGAVVQVTDDIGNLYTFTEVSPGTYLSDPAQFTAQTGRKYKLLVETTDGSRYESDFEEMKKAPEIDSLHWQYKEKPSLDPDNPVKGIEILVNTHDPENKTRYYSWNWYETWEFYTPYHKDTIPSHCWKYDSCKVIQIGSTDHLTEDILENFPLYYISENTNRLSVRYSVLVKQYSLTKEAFNYWSRIRETNENTGTLFDPIPTQVEGNIKDIGNPDKPVLGYFQASAVTSRRIFISRSELMVHKLFISSGFEYCESEMCSDTLGAPIPCYFDAVENYGWVVYFQEVSGSYVYAYLTNSVACYDCSVNGSPVRPDFWTD
jgi:hypothetical protein